MEKVQLVVPLSPGGAHGEVAELGEFIGGIPALENEIPSPDSVFRSIGFKPALLVHAAAGGTWRLLKLAGKVVRTQGRCNLVLRVAILARRLYHIAFVLCVVELCSIQT